MAEATKDWRALGAGRDLDALVAERVMGWGWMTHDQPEVLPRKRWLAPPDQVGDFGHVRPADMSEPTEEPWWLDIDGRHIGPNEWRVPRFSTDIAAAWQVVEEMQACGHHAVVKTPFCDGDPYWAGFTPHGVTGWNGVPDHRASADTPALAICRAALAYAEAR